MAYLEQRKLLPSIFNRDFPDLIYKFPTITDLESYIKGNDTDSRGLTVYEHNNKFIVEAAIPGLKQDEIEINLNKGVLWIKGEKKEEESDKDKRFYRKSYSTYSYSVALPEQVDDKQEPEASYEHGILKVIFQKAKSAESKRIEIKTKK